jgi:N-methylhydantoinase A
VIFLAVDIGGTFTDLIAYDGATKTLYQAKSLTTYDDLTRGRARLREEKQRRAC